MYPQFESFTRAQLRQMAGLRRKSRALETPPSRPRGALGLPSTPYGVRRADNGEEEEMRKLPKALVEPLLLSLALSLPLPLPLVLVLVLVLILILVLVLVLVLVLELDTCTMH